MKRRACSTFLLTAIIISLGIFIYPLSAAMEKELKIDSVPSGAEVYLRQATREILLGKTPLVHKLEFHSEISVIRMLFKKAGYKPLNIEVSASQNEVVAKLEALAIAAEPEIHKDAHLRKIQKEINAIINRTVPKLLEEKGQQDFDLAAPINIQAEGEKVFLVVPIAIGNIKGEIRGKGEARQDLLLRTLWKELGDSLAIPLAREVRNQVEIYGLSLEIKLDEKRYIFSAEPTVDTKVEMQCVPGYRTQMVLQFYQEPVYETYWDPNTRRTERRLTGYRSQSRLVPQQVYDPCLFRQPVTKHSVKLDPKVSLTKEQAIAQYLLPLKFYDEKVPSQELYEKLGVLLIDSKGNELRRHGSIAFPITSFPATKAKNK